MVHSGKNHRGWWVIILAIRLDEANREVEVGENIVNSPWPIGVTILDQLDEFVGCCRDFVTFAKLNCIF